MPRFQIEINKRCQTKPVKQWNNKEETHRSVDRTKGVTYHNPLGQLIKRKTKIDQIDFHDNNEHEINQTPTCIPQSKTDRSAFKFSHCRIVFESVH